MKTILKKKLKDTKIGNVLINLAKGGLKEVPIVGGLIHNAVEESEGAPKGVINKTQATGQLIAVIALSLGVAALVKHGIIDFQVFYEVLSLIGL